MKTKAILCLIAVFGIIISCKNNKIHEDTIDISASLNNKSLQQLSSIAVKIEYIKLQSDSSCYIGRIKYPYPKIKFYSSKIFIADNSRLLSFSSDGKFLTQIGTQGRGPGEYQDITDFAFLPDVDEVVVFSSAFQRVSFFSMDGKFLRDMKVDFFPRGFTTFNHKLIFNSSRSQRERSDFHALLVLSADGEIQDHLIDRQDENEKGKMGAGAGGSHIYTVNNALNYWDSFYDTIWTFSNNFKLISKRSINVGDDMLPFNYSPGSQTLSIEVMKKFVTFQYYFETERHMFIELNNKGIQNHIYFDKSTGKSFNLQLKEEIGNLSYLSFNNDIDGGFPFWPDGSIAENKVFSIIYVPRLIKYFNDHFDLIDSKTNTQNKELLHLFEQSKVEDNPILMIVTLKN